MRFRVALLLLLGSTPAFAEVVVSKQVLDTVNSFTPGAVLEMGFADIGNGPAFKNLNFEFPGSNLNLNACTATAAGGVYCLDGQVVRQWANPHNPDEMPKKVFDCTADFPVVLRLGKSDGCVAMTVDIKGQIWLAVKKGNGHNVRKVVPTGIENCTDTPFCFGELYTGRPPIVDLIPVNGELAKAFKVFTPCSTLPACSEQSGVMGIEERKHAVFFPDATGAAPTTVVSATAWNVKGKELLQDISLLQLGTAETGLDTGVLATTTQGKVLARRITGSSTARVVMNLPLQRKGVAGDDLPYIPQLGTCNATGSQYSIRVSSTTQHVYISESNCFQVINTQSLASNFDSLSSLGYVNHLPTANFGVVGLMIAPGGFINLAEECSSSSGCPLAKGVTGPGPEFKPASNLSGVQVTTPESGATVFQIKGIPDCRMGLSLGDAEKKICAEKSKDPLVKVVMKLDGSKVDIVNTGLDIGKLVLDPDPNMGPARLKLNVTPLLPEEIKVAFKASYKTNLPDLLISPQYLAPDRPEQQHVFEAFFVLTQPGVRFQNTFNSEYLVGILEGQGTEHYNCLVPVPLIGSKRPLIQWDITTHVSELNPSVGGEYIDTLSNVGCGSIRGASATLSMLPYDLRINPDTYVPHPTNNSGLQYIPNNDAVFARLLQKLYGDLWLVQTQYACTNYDVTHNQDLADNQYAQPINPSLCATLTQRWDNGLSKLNDCVKAAFVPKSSASNQLCQAFSSQLSNYKAVLPATTPSYDIANRVGQLKARIETLFHLYNDRFLPSIPNGGFCRETSFPAFTNCPNPWL